MCGDYRPHRETSEIQVTTAGPELAKEAILYLLQIQCHSGAQRLAALGGCADTHARG